MQNLKDVIKQIEEASKISEVAQETRLTGFLDGVEVAITIRDRGENDPLRWSVWAETLDVEPTRTAGSNPGADLSTVIATTHWYQLLPPESR